MSELVAPLLVLGAVLNLAGLLTWAERKQSALMQDRIGANRADILGIRILGLFHPIADGLKMLTKEDFVPAKANRPLHTLAPWLAVFSPLFAFAFVPFASDVVVAPHPYSALLVLAVGSFGVYGVVLAGWASHNKFSLLGALRGSAQMLSYELVLGLAVLSMVLTYGTLDLRLMAEAQQGRLFGVLPAWGIFLQPVNFLLFLVAAIAETKRVPFDLPEGESEIIGFFAEYSGMKFGMFMLGEFIETVLASAMITLLFFGGWGVGFDLPLQGWPLLLAQYGIFLAKTSFFCFFLLLVRWTLPRLRIDQLQTLCWKRLLELAFLNVLVTAGVILWLAK